MRKTVSPKTCGWRWHVAGSKETRAQFYTRTLVVTLGSVVYGLLALIGVLPHVFSLVGLSQRAESLAAIFRWPVTLLIVMIGLSIVYRIGPSRTDARWRWATLGSALAAVLLVAVSMIFTWYVAEFTVTIEFMAPWVPRSVS